MTDTSPALASVTVFRRLWLIVVLTCSLLLMPVAMILLLTGKVYRKRSEGWQPISNQARYIYGGLLVLWLVAATGKALLQPGGLKQEWADNTDTQVASNSQPDKAEPPPQPKTVEHRPDQASVGSPDMKVQIEPEYSNIIITADDDTPFIVQRIVLNGREGEEKCDFRHLEIADDMTPEQKMMVDLRTKLPSDEMKRGDRIKFGSTCGETLSVRVYTDHGVSEYNFN